MTDDVNSNDEHHTDPADALADLARGNSDAAATDPGEFAVATTETTVNDVSEEVFAGGSSPSEDSGREHITAGAGYSRHHAHMYKKTMIPLMLVVGAMLVLIGFAAAAMVLRAEPDDKFYTWYSRMEIVMYVSFPLAALVLVGAWWFHRDVTK